MDRHEFLCPLCKGLSNAVLPILPNRSCVVRPIAPSEGGQADMATWLEGLSLLVENSREIKYSKADGNLFATNSLQMDTKFGAVKTKLFWNVLEAADRPKIANHFYEMASVFAQAVYTVRLELDYYYSCIFCWFGFCS